MPHLCVVLLHSTDDPDVAVAGLDAARSAAEAGRKVALYLAAEGSRLGARGVAEALSGHGRPDVKAWLSTVASKGGRILVSAPDWASRGYAADALVEGAKVVGPEALSALVEEGYSPASF